MTATVGGEVSGQISAGLRKSHTGCREVPTGEEWVVTSVAPSAIEDAGQGNSTAVLTMALKEAHPTSVVDAQREWRVGAGVIPVITRENFLGGSFFFVSVQADTAGPSIVSGIINVDVFKA